MAFIFVLFLNTACSAFYSFGQAVRIKHTFSLTSYFGESFSSPIFSQFDRYFIWHFIRFVWRLKFDVLLPHSMNENDLEFYAIAFRSHHIHWKLSHAFFTLQSVDFSSCIGISLRPKMVWTQMQIDASECVFHSASKRKQRNQKENNKWMERMEGHKVSVRWFFAFNFIYIIFFLSFSFIAFCQVFCCCQQPLFRLMSIKKEIYNINQFFSFSQLRDFSYFHFFPFFNFRSRFYFCSSAISRNNDDFIFDGSRDSCRTQFFLRMAHEQKKGITEEK